MRTLFTTLGALSHVLSPTTAQATSSNIIDILNANGFTNFSSLLTSSGIIDQINDRSDITILAPTNGAIHDPRNIQFINPQIASYHVLQGCYDSYDSFPPPGTYSYIPTLLPYPSGEYAQVGCGPGFPLVPGKSGIAFDSAVLNHSFLNTTAILSNDTGIPAIWGFDDYDSGVMIPPQDLNTTIIYLENSEIFVRNNTELSFANHAFLDGLERSGLLAYIDALPQVSLFVPTDQALEAASNRSGNIETLNGSALRDVLMRHIVPGVIERTEFKNASFTAQALNGATLDFRFATVKNLLTYLDTYVNNAFVFNFVGGHIFLPNGVGYFIDEVLYPGVTAEPVVASSSGYVPEWNPATALTSPATYIDFVLSTISTSSTSSPMATTTTADASAATSALVATTIAPTSAIASTTISSQSSTDIATTTSTTSSSTNRGTTTATVASTLATSTSSAAATRCPGLVEAAMWAVCFGAVVGAGVA